MARNRVDPEEETIKTQVPSGREYVDEFEVHMFFPTKESSTNPFVMGRKSKCGIPLLVTKLSLSALTERGSVVPEQQGERPHSAQSWGTLS